MVYKHIFTPSCPHRSHLPALRTPRPWSPSLRKRRPMSRLEYHPPGFVVPATPERGDPSQKVILFGRQRGESQASNFSHFVTKTEAFLRLAGIPFEARATGPSPAGPKQKLPWIQHGPQEVAETELILDFLERTYPDKAEPLRPSPDRRARAIAARIVSEDEVYLHSVHFRFCTEEGWAVTRCLFQGLPEKERDALAEESQKKRAQSLWQMGISRHAPQDRDALLRRALDALSGLLGDDDFFGGASPCREDCGVFGMLDCILYSPAPEAVAGLIRRDYPSLVSYTERFRARVFPHIASRQELTDGSVFPLLP